LDFHRRENQGLVRVVDSSEKLLEDREGFDSGGPSRRVSFFHPGMEFSISRFQRTFFEGCCPCLDPPFDPTYNAKNLTANILMMKIVGNIEFVKGAYVDLRSNPRIFYPFR
jgi:hypothetical protein